MAEAQPGPDSRPSPERKKGHVSIPPPLDVQTPVPSNPSSVRQRAEAKASADEAKALQVLSPKPERQILHDLRVHQIELEMQNEELRRAEAELEASRARYFELYDMAPVGYCTLDEQGLILEANLTAGGLLNVERRALVKQPLTRFIVKEDQDIYYRYRQQLSDKGASHVCELRMLREGAAPFWARVESTAAQNGNGNPVYRTVMSDISKLKLAQAEREELEAQNRQLQKAESLGRMAKAVAHHFNNQLQAVMGQLELALGKLPPDADAIRNLNAAMQAASIAADISGMARTYLGQSSGKKEPFNFCNLCVLGLPMLNAILPKNVTLETALASPGPDIDANANQIQQILTNLVTNAWEAIGDDQGTIRLTIKTVPSAEIPAAQRFPIDWQPQDSAYACMEVTDTGCGIAREQLDKLFDPFFSSKFIGRGMGLSVVLGILRAHCGAITVKSETGHGSTFRVFLPVSAKKAERQAEHVNQAPVEGTGTVLLVEDEDVVREMAGEMLMQMGYTVLKAQDGIEAIEVFRQHQAEIRSVVCDLTMPRLDGWGTLAALRKLAPALPVVLISGYDESEVMAESHPEKPSAFLKKPFQFEHLAETIGVALARGAEARKKSRSVGQVG